MKSLFNEDVVEITFEDFYKLYPRKESRKNAERSFKKLSEKDKVLAYKGLEKHLKSWRSTGKEIQYISHPSTWINQRRWEDELEHSFDVGSEKSTSEPSENPTLIEVRKSRESEYATREEILEILREGIGKGRRYDKGEVPLDENGDIIKTKEGI